MIAGDKMRKELFVIGIIIVAIGGFFFGVPDIPVWVNYVLIAVGIAAVAYAVIIDEIDKK